MHSIPGSTVIAFLENLEPRSWPLALELLRGLRCMRQADGGVLSKVVTGRKRWDLDYCFELLNEFGAIYCMFLHD